MTSLLEGKFEIDFPGAICSKHRENIFQINGLVICVFIVRINESAPNNSYLKIYFC